MKITEQSLRDIIARHGGTLAAGVHSNQYGEPDCPLCIMEAHAACLVERGELEQITDDPDLLGRPDYRAINDAFRDDQTRTDQMIRLHVAYEGWADWSEDRRRAVIDRIIIQTVRRIISVLPGPPDDVRRQCEAVETLDAAHATVVAIAAHAAHAAAHAADRDAVLIEAVAIWVEAVRQYA